MTANAELSVRIALSETGANALGGPYWNGAIDLVASLANGTGANAFDLAFMEERTVLTGANDDIDVRAALLTALGVAFTPAELVGVAIINRQRDGTVNTTNLTIGGAANFVPGFSAVGGSISPGGIFLAFSPGAAGLATIAAGTADILRVTNSAGATNKYMLALMGRTA